MNALGAGSGSCQDTRFFLRSVRSSFDVWGRENSECFNRYKLVLCNGWGRTHVQSVFIV